MLSQQELLLSDVLLQFYGGIRDPEFWKPFLSSLATMTESNGAALLVQNLQKGTVIGVSEGYDSTGEQLYRQHYASINPWMPNPNERLPRANVVSGDDFLPLTKLRETEFYNDWGKRNGVAHSISANVNIEDHKLFYLGLSRSEKRGMYGQPAVDLLSVLSPHLQQGLLIQEHIHAQQQLVNSLESASGAVFISNSAGRVLHMSKAAHGLIQKNDGFALERKYYLRPTHRDDRKKLADAFERATNTSVKIPSTLPIRRPNGGRDHLVFLQPLSDQRSSFSRAEIAILVMRPDVLNSAWIQSVAGPLFRLTRAETRLVLALLQNGSLDGAMESLNRTRNTVKSQMTSIFRKTNTKRQGEVIRLFTSIANIAPSDGV